MIALKMELEPVQMIMFTKFFVSVREVLPL